MKPNEIDAIWQSLLDEEKQRLASLPAEELRALDLFMSCEIPNGETAIDYGLWHEKPGYRKDREFHSFILQAKRKLSYLLPKTI